MWMLFKNKINIRFLYINIGFVLLFSILYYLQDVFITKNIKLAQKLHLLDTKNIEGYSDRVSPFSYYLWFSLMTQTTVGYGGVDNGITGKSLTFLQEPNRLAKIINTLQLLSILFTISIV